jgi:Uma2 family endonuclease
MSTQPKHLLTPEQYLEIERNAAFKSEYYQGEMFAMSSARWVHNLIVADLLFALVGQLRSRPCAVCPNDMRVRVSATGLYTYPDILVVCGEPQFLDSRQDTLLNPGVIIDVLSPSTEAYDRGRKFEHYRSLESLSAYLLVSSERTYAELYSRQPGAQWLLATAERPEDTLEFPSIGCQLKLAEVYLKSGLLPTAG